MLELSPERNATLLNYQMKSDLFDLETLKEAEDFVLWKFKEAVFIGQMQKGKRHGWGVMKYEGKRVYEG